MSTLSNQSSPRLIPNFLSMSVFSVISMILGLAGTILITRNYSVEEFGVYTLVLVFVTFLSQISTLGLELSVPKFIAGAQDELSREIFFSTAVMIRIGSILLTSLLAWYGGPLLKILFGQSLLPSFVLYVPLLFAIESLRALLRATLQGNFLFFKIGIADTIAGSTNLIFIVFIYLIKGDITFLLLARAFSSFLTCIFSLVSIPIKKRLSFRISALKEFLKFGYPLQINNLMSFFYSRIDTIAVALFLGPAEIAAYEVARKIPDYLRIFYEPFRSVYFPSISKRYAVDGPQQAAKLVNDANRFVAFVTLLGAAIATLFGREILQLIFTSKYSSSAPVFAILMVNLSFGLMGNIMGTTLVSVGDTKKPAVINFFNMAASWLGSILLIPPFRLIGASIANTVGTLISLPINYYFLKKRVVLNTTAYLKLLVLFCAWELTVLFIKPELLIVKALFLILFILACFILSIITKQDIVKLIDGLQLSSWPPIKKLVMWISQS